MSLADQSQQWFPTSVQVTVHQARNLRIKGKNGTNDAYAIIQVAKDKFSTSVAEKCVAPAWKEEATFDLPLFHQSNAERCTLYIIIMHRAQVGLDKLLGQAVINLVDLHDNNSCKKTDWFKLMDKAGKEDKARGEVLLDIQFKRNNMSASMFDLSMQDKPRSRISKLKDKVRGKKKDGFSDSASAIVPSVSQVLTDSEGEADAQSLNQSPGLKKKSKFKTLFAPKSNLQRNVSQSMSTLGTLPEKNSSLSGSRSSGLNTDSPEVKKKFKFLGHKRTGSNDSKVSQGPFSLLGRSKLSSNDQNNLCINGSHVYAEEVEPKSGSTLSLNSSGQSSVEDVCRHNSDVSADSLKGLAVPSYRQESTDRAMVEQQRHQEEEERRQAEEQRRAEAKRLQEEEELKYQEEQERRKKLREEEETKRKKLKEEEEARRKKLKEEEDTRRKKLKEEEDARRKMLREEEEERRKQEEERRRLEAAGSQRLENERERLEEEKRLQDEAQRAEERKRQEEASMSDRLSSLFGMIRKKEEKKEEMQQKSSAQEEAPQPAPRAFSRDPEVPSSHRYTNPFEEIPLSPDPPNATDGDRQTPVRNPQLPSAMVFLNRTPKVSAVKPRLAESLKLEPTDSHAHSQQCSPSPTTPESTLSSIPESPVMFSNLHSSLAPPKTRKSSSESSLGSAENLSSVGSSPTMSEKKRRAPLPPAHGMPTQMELRGGSPAGGHLTPIREIENPGYIETDRHSQHGKRPALPLPDYETLFPQKRHGVQGHTRWDHIIAEVNQRQRDYPPELLGREMSVDGPEEHTPSLKSSLMQERSAVCQQHTQPHEAKPMSSKKGAAPLSPTPVAATPPTPVADFNQKPSQRFAQAPPPVERPNTSAVPGPAHTVTSRREAPSVIPRDEVNKVPNTSAVSGSAHTVTSRRETPSVIPRDEVNKVPNTSAVSGPAHTVPSRREAPSVMPRDEVNKVPNTSAVSGPAHTVPSRREAPSVIPRDEVNKVPNTSAVPGPAHTVTSRREAPSVIPRDEVNKVLNTSATVTDSKYLLPTEVLRPTTREGWDTRPADDQKELPVNITKEIPTAKPRQKVGSKEPMKQADPDVTPQVSANNVNGNDQTFSKSVLNNMDKNIREANDKFAMSDPFPTTELLSKDPWPQPEQNQISSKSVVNNNYKNTREAKEKFAKSDPFPTAELLSKDPWSQLEQNHRVDDLFTGRVQKLEDQGMTPDDLDQLFTPDNPSDPFSSFNSSESEKHPEQGKKDSNQLSPAFQRRNSQRRKPMLPSVAKLDYKGTKAHQGSGPNEETMTTANQDLTPVEAPGTSITSASLRLQHQADVKSQSSFYVGERVETQSREDPFGADPFTVPSSSPMSSVLTAPEPPQSVLEEATSQPGGLSGGKTLIRAWVSPSEVQPPNAQSCNGGGLVFSTPRRPHPVKPLSSIESQHPTSAPAVREIKTHNTTVGKIKVADSVESGPYTQLTQEELITLVVKQQTELSKKNAKIIELEEYIDNLLVRVIEEKPSILLALNASKSA